jgi:hypothetical protein
MKEREVKQERSKIDSEHSGEGSWGQSLKI